MAEMDEFRPKDWVPIEIKPGKYAFCVEVKKCSFKDTEKEKAYMQIAFIVIDGEMKGFEFDERVYISKKAEWRARYFLKKFDYPADLLEQQPPTLRKAKIEGLQGKILADASVDNFGMLKIEVKKFDHIGGTEIEDELAKEQGTQEELPLQTGTDAEPTREINVNADVEGTPGSAPGREPGDEPVDDLFVSESAEDVPAQETPGDASVLDD